MSLLCWLYKDCNRILKFTYSRHRPYDFCISSRLTTSPKKLIAFDQDARKRSVKEKTTLAQMLVNNSPKFALPYLKIMRADQPIGTWLLFCPCAWSISLAALPNTLPDPYLLLLFGCGSFLMRGAGCVINDMWDKDYDKKVARTSSRPLACGVLNYGNALTLLFFQYGLAVIILFQLNWYSVILGLSSTGLIVGYPLMKRVTYWPQLALGCTFNWGTLVGWSAVQGSCHWAACLPLYCAAISWTLIYDTIYAHQDKKDDLLIGVKSTALKFGDNTKTWLTGFSMVMMSGLTCTGIMTDVAWPYYLAVAAAGGHLFKQIHTLQIDNPEDCAKKFRSNKQLGLLLFLGCAFGTYLK